VYISCLLDSGEYELTMDGIHENFLRLSYHDPMMQKTVEFLESCYFFAVDFYPFGLACLTVSNQFIIIFYLKVRCLDTIGVSDSLLRYISRTQHMSLYGNITFFTLILCVLSSHNLICLMLLELLICSLSTTYRDTHQKPDSTVWEAKYWMAKVFTKVKSVYLTFHPLLVFIKTNYYTAIFQMPGDASGEEGFI